ncbi:MAG TPA: hypothetical protein VKB79_22745 [Bryobacteraceae bacterium]|nr:hypothetical protein [Bryobacteraceae bacterium]
MKKVIALSLLLAACSTALFAGVAPAPEIDANSATTAVMLLGAGVLMLRGRRSR